MALPKIYQLPNLLTYGRILAVPLVVACFFFDEPANRWIAWSIYALAAITDFLDGYLARIWKQQSALGKMLDPIADKLLIAATLLMLASDGTISDFALIPAIIILLREILVSGLREFLAEIKVSVPVTWLAKWKTTLQLIAIGLLLLGPSGAIILPPIVEIGIFLLWLSALLTLYTGWDYFRASLRYLLEDNE